MAFKIHGEVSLDGAMFKRGLADIGGSTTAFLKNFALGAIGIASVEQAFSKTIESAKELVNTSKKLDITIEQLQVMRQAADESGVGFDQMGTALERFNAVRENILNGGKGSAAQMAAMQRLGVSAEDLKNKTAAENMMGGISATAQKSNAADIANDLKQVFGRGGQELFGALKTNFSELEARMKSFGALMGTDVAVKLKAVADDFSFLSRVVTAQLAPALLSLALWAIKIATNVGGGVAALAGGLGAQTAGKGFWGGLGTLWMDSFKGQLWALSLGHYKPPKDEAFMNGAADAQSPYKAFLESLEKSMAEAAERAKHPIPQDTSTDVPDSEKPAKEPRAKEIKSDSLISVGNFLGSGGRAINGIAQEQLQVSKEHLNESKLLSKHAENISKQIETFRGHGAGVEW